METDSFTEKAMIKMKAILTSSKYIKWTYCMALLMQILNEAYLPTSALLCYPYNLIDFYPYSVTYFGN